MPKLIDIPAAIDRAALPGWPALLTKKLAAAYVGFSERWIEMHVSAGSFPQPKYLGDSPRWRRADVDEWIAK